MKFRVYIILFLLSLATGCSTPAKHVLVIHSYEESFPLYPEYDEMIADNFSSKGIKANIRTFYLDCESHREQEETDRISHLLDSLYDWRPDIILVNDDQATYSLLMTGHELLKMTPVVFAGVNYPNWSLIKKFPNVTGFHDKIDILKNMEVIKEFSHRSTCFTLLDSTFLDRKIRADIDQHLNNYTTLKHVEDFVDSLNQDAENNYKINIYLARRKTKGETPPAEKYISMDYLWEMSKFNTGNPYLQLKYDFSTVTIANFYMNNRYSAIYEMFGCGFSFRGGYMTPLSTQVKEEVDLAVQILNGTRPQDIPVRESAKAYVVDWQTMKKAGFKQKDIPAKYMIINLPFKEHYPKTWFFIIFSSLAILLTLFTWLTFLYMREIKMRRQVLYDLEEERESLALAIEGGNTFAWRIKRDMLQFKNAFWKSSHIGNASLSVDEFTAFIHPDYRTLFRQYWQKVLTQGTHTIELLCDFTKEGYQWWEFRSSTMDSMSGQQKTTGLIVNIDEYKKREQELIEARELAEKAELKQSFLANMSHEIRTPLNAIVGFSNILVSGVELDEDEKQLYINTINTNSELLLKLINDILEISRIESGYMSFDFQKYPVATLIDEVYNTHQVIVPSHLQFLKECDKAQPEIYVDKSRLTQVLTNFLNNAGKFTPSGYVKLGYQYFPKEKQVHIFVEDSGKGIPKAEQKMIFSRFYKQDEFAQGTGLGLSICQVIIEKLGGRIVLWSEPGKGSRFTVILSCDVIG